MDQGSYSVDREIMFKDWRFDDLSREYRLQDLKKLLSSDRVLKIIKPKLTGSLRRPISAPKLILDVLEAPPRRIKLLTEAEWAAGTFNALILLECNHDRVIAAGQSLC